MIIKRHLPELILFTFFLAAGFVTGRLVVAGKQTVQVRALPTGFPETAVPLPPTALPAFASRENDNQLEPSSQPAIAGIEENTLTSGNQSNILLIGVDDLQSARPRLESLWLAVYVPRTQRVMLLPVYPHQPGGMNDTPSNSPADYFQIDGDGAPAKAFLAHLKESDLLWSAYLLTDRQGVTQAMELLNPGKFADQVVAGLSPAADDPAAALWAQADLLKTLCAGNLDLPEAQALPFITSQVRSNLDLSLVMAQWRQVNAQGGLTCEFPTLGLAYLTD